MQQVPETYNMLSNLDGVMIIPRLPQVSYWVQTIKIPNVSLPMAEQPTAFSGIPVHGMQTEYGNLVAEFLVDENMTNYMEMKDWLDQIGMPDGEMEYTDFAGSKSDISVLILNSNKRPNVEFLFEQCVPYDLSLGLDMTSTEGTVRYQTATVSFSTRKFYMKKL